MKPNLLSLTAFLLILAGIVTSCKDKVTDEPEITYPIDIPFEEYSEGASCQLFVPSSTVPNDALIMIHSNEELEKYIKCWDGTYPAIDFSKYTLILGGGNTLKYRVTSIQTCLQQISSKNYRLNVEVNLELTISTEFKFWAISILVDKTVDVSNIELNLIKIKNM